MSRAGKLVAWVAVTYAAVLAVLLAIGLMLASGLPAENAVALRHILELRAPALLLTAVLLLLACAGIVQWIFADYVTPVQVLAEQTRVIRGANSDLRLSSAGAREFAELAAAVNALADDYRGLQRDSESRAAEARSRLEEERNRLAALMSELTQGVLVCNVDGTILLYNEQARTLFSAPDAASRNPSVGLGRSLFALLDRGQVAHTLQKLQRNLARAEPLPSARLVATTAAGRLIKAQVAPFLDADARLAGMVLALEDVTILLGRESQRRAMLQTLAAGIRAPAANIRAAAENLAAYPEIDPPSRTQFVDIIATEARALSISINHALREYADALKVALALEDMRATDLLEYARQRIAGGLQVTTELTETDEGLWIRVDSYAFVQAIAHLVGRLREDYGVSRIDLHARSAERFAEIDVSWRGAMVASEALSLWEVQPMQDGPVQSPLTIRDVLERHGGEVWFQAAGEGGSRSDCFRFLVPRGEPTPVQLRTAGATGSRPEYYDFDLFDRGIVGEGLNEAQLATLNFTVFDTETTGLEPSAGDEIISIGAVRVVNGRVLRNEVYEQLIDPRRPLSAASVRVHGINAAALAGQPTIGAVLPGFHRFCEGTVLVAHNAAFDMRFLELKQASTGVRFTQPVLDTLLLSAVAHPNLEEHTLEAIAGRLGVSVMGRHTALGDALLTGEILLKLLPLLAERGVLTLGQALEASRKSYYARLQY